MKVIKEDNFSHVFPIKIKCEKTVDRYGFSYGDEKDFCGSELEVELTDIKKHDWGKYPCYTGIDYGVICPVCGQFLVIERNKIPKKVLNDAERIYLNI